MSPSIVIALGFVLLYGINPVIIYFVTFPFYYFWQVVPSFVLVLLLMKGEDTLRPTLQRITIFALCVLIGLVVLARPTTLPLSLFTLGVALLIAKRKKTILVGAIVAAIIGSSAFIPPQRNFWHTAYIGVGAYPNPFGVQGLSDNFGYALFERKTGHPINASLGGNMYDPVVMDRYKKIARDEYMRMVREQPAIFVRNAALNILQSYAVGYVNGAPAWVHYLSALLGLCVMVALLYSYQYLTFIAIGLASGGFSLYFPPIQAYMYGSCILIVFGGLRFVVYMLDRRDHVGLR